MSFQRTTLILLMGSGFSRKRAWKSLTLEGKCFHQRIQPAHLGGHFPGIDKQPDHFNVFFEKDYLMRRALSMMLQQQIQQKASRIASEQKLGALQKEYHTQCRTGPLPATIFQVLSLLFSCWLIFLSVSQFVPVLQAFSSFFASFSGLCFFLGPFFLIVSLILCWSYWEITLFVTRESSFMSMVFCLSPAGMNTSSAQKRFAGVR